MKTNRFRLFTIVCTAVLLFALSTNALFAQGKGKKGGGDGGDGGGGDPPSAPVEYQLTLFGAADQTTVVFNMNGSGTVVGYTVDTNNVQNAMVWQAGSGVVNLNHVANVPEGWVLTSARGINESGQIAGTAQNLSTSQLVAFRYDPTLGDAELMQTFNDDDHPAAWNDPINEAGDVVYYQNSTSVSGPDVIYQCRVFVDTADGQLFDVLVDGSWATAINDRRQVVGTGAFRLSLGATPENTYEVEYFDDLGEIQNINNSGYFPSSTQRKKRGSYLLSAIRYSTSVEVLQQDDSVGVAINSVTHNSNGELTSKGDVIGSISSSNGAFLHMDEYGYFDLDDLITGLPADLDQWLLSDYVFAKHITDRDATGFGTICGWISTADGERGFVLSPVPSP